MDRAILGIIIVYLALAQSACSDAVRHTRESSPANQEKQQAAPYQGMTGKEWQDQCQRLSMMIVGYPGDCSTPQVGSQRSQNNYDAGEVYRRTYDSSRRAVCAGESSCY